MSVVKRDTAQLMIELIKAEIQRVEDDTETAKQCVQILTDRRQRLLAALVDVSALSVQDFGCFKPESVADVHKEEITALTETIQVLPLNGGKPT